MLVGIQVDWKIRRVSKKSNVYHTIGAAIYCGKEIELNLPLHERQALDVINTVVSYCKEKNAKIKPNKKMIQIISIPVIFKVMFPITEGNESILRMAIADENGMFPGDVGCNPLYEQQHALSKRLS